MDRRMAILAGAALALALASPASAEDVQGVAGEAWRAIVLPQTEEVAAIVTGVAVGPDAIVAVGQKACDWRGKQRGDIGRCWGQPWISPDGVTWEAVEPRTSGLDLGRFQAATSGPEVGLDGVAYGPGGYVAYGWQNTSGQGQRSWNPRPALWRSEDGRAWERVETPESFAGEHLMQLGPWLSDIAGTQTGYLLVGTIFGTPAPRAAIWSSADGRTWTLVEDDDAFDVGAYIDTMEIPGTGGIAAIAVPPGATDAREAIAVGAACPPARKGAGPRGGDWRRTYDWTTGDCWAQQWQTDDGTSWEASTFEAAADGALPDGAWWASDIATDGTQSVVGTYSGYLLRGNDGSGWEVVGAEPVGRQLALAAGADGFHALVPRCMNEKCRRKTLDLWSSSDGATWDPAPAQPTLPVGMGEFVTGEAAALGDRVIVVAGGMMAPGGDLVSMVLISPSSPMAAPAQG